MTTETRNEEITQLLTSVRLDLLPAQDIFRMMMMVMMMMI
jgi:hypothetical protein